MAIKRTLIDPGSAWYYVKLSIQCESWTQKLTTLTLPVLEAPRPDRRQPPRARRATSEARPQSPNFTGTRATEAVRAGGFSEGGKIDGRQITAVRN